MTDMQFTDPSIPTDALDTDLDVQFRDVRDDGWRLCTITGRVGGYQFEASGMGSRDERALAYALEVLARQLHEAFPRLYVQ